MQIQRTPLHRHRAATHPMSEVGGATPSSARGWLRAASLPAGMGLLVLSLLATPASAGTTLVQGTTTFNDTCQPPVGAPPANLGDLPPLDFSGSLVGCWYTYISASRFNPSGTYVEQGTEYFVGCLNGTTCGTFETTYTFTGKYRDDSFAEPLFGRCEHSIVGGTGDFAGAKGVITIRDDVVNLVFNYRGQIQLAKPGTAASLKSSQPAGTAVRAQGLVRTAGC